MPGLLIGCTRVSANDQDLTAQKKALLALDATPERPSPTRASPAPSGPSPISARCEGRSRRTHPPRGQAQHRRLRRRPHRSGRPIPLQCPCHGRRIRNRPVPGINPASYGDHQGKWAVSGGIQPTSQETHPVPIHRAGTHTTAEGAELFSMARSRAHRAINSVGDITGWIRRISPSTPESTPIRPQREFRTDPPQASSTFRLANACGPRPQRHLLSCAEER